MPTQGQTRASPSRDGALDAFRGLVVLAMLLVNLQGSHAQAYAPLAHAAWHGLTLADLVFPFFLLVVGLSVPLALDRPGPRPAWAPILRRTALLVLIGVALNWLLQPALPLAELRLTGVLQRIGLVYLACAAAALLWRGALAPLRAAVALMVLHAALLLMPAPGEALASMEPGLGLSGWADRELLPGRAHRGTHDPEGVLSTLSAIATGLLGVAAARFQATGGSAKRLASVGAGAVLLGLALTPLLPLNKSLWTASFALVSAGLGLLCLLGLRAVWERVARQAWARGAVLLGRTALTLYVLHMLLIALLVRQAPDGRRLWTHGFEALAATDLPAPTASLLFAILASALCAAAMPPLRRRGWLLRA
ncbi:MAG TPA: heparan-alpha-glucosaminide N-acetyltransferase domain-containing protein [Azospirillaceae bacterium]|nr:heparan-alpha-glucosaminide N-acetyltransferase domain-containing protein [Azospirillaceae bacterium]